MSLISKIKADKAGTVLFLMSFSVILITLGIIQTLLFVKLNAKLILLLKIMIF